MVLVISDRENFNAIFSFPGNNFFIRAILFSFSRWVGGNNIFVRTLPVPMFRFLLCNLQSILLCIFFDILIDTLLNNLIAILI
jgi:hypothetical protein